MVLLNTALQLVTFENIHTGKKKKEYVLVTNYNNVFNDSE